MSGAGCTPTEMGGNGVFTSRTVGKLAQMVVPSSARTLDVSPRNLERWATISDAIMSKSLIFRTRRSMRTCLNPSQNFSRCSPVNSSGDPRAVRTASSVQLLVSLVDQMECKGRKSSRWLLYNPRTGELDVSEMLEVACGIVAYTPC